MIGVIAKPHQGGVIEEFFELFKTPWEFYRGGGVYDTVISTVEETPAVTAKLLLVYGAAANSIDARIGTAPGSRCREGRLTGQNVSFPVYGPVSSFRGVDEQASVLSAGSETVGFTAPQTGCTVVRIGFDLFDEVQFLMTTGQPVEYAHIPTIEIHIALLRQWMLDSGISFLEIPPAPSGHDFFGCLTHDIDFIGIRNHLFDHTMWGFLYRATVGSIKNYLRGRLTAGRLCKNWLAAASLPFVYLGLVKDFWEPFEWYLRVEEGLGGTYFLIPFKQRAGEKVPGPHAGRRATAYDVSDLRKWCEALMRNGCEVGVHGIDSWHSVARGRAEQNAVASVAGNCSKGIRMHWLLWNEDTPSVLQEAGYQYDATCGYNDTIGYRAGTGQVFGLLGVSDLLELPLHVQDGALFYPQKLDLSEAEAMSRCSVLIENARKVGGVLTLLWHDRSHAPERFWGEFYAELVGKLKSLNCRFGTAEEIVTWFRKRRTVRFERVGNGHGPSVRLRCSGRIEPPLRIRIYAPQQHRTANPQFTEAPWDGRLDQHIEANLSPLLSDAS